MSIPFSWTADGNSSTTDCSQLATRVGCRRASEASEASEAASPVLSSSKFSSHEVTIKFYSISRLGQEIQHFAFLGDDSSLSLEHLVRDANASFPLD